MSNTNNNNIQHLKQDAHESDLHVDLPPLSLDEVLSNQTTVCETVRAYLGVWADLTPEQRRPVSIHVQNCQQCAYERQLFWGATREIARLPETQPSARVDRAVLDAIIARSKPATSTRGKAQKSEHFAPSSISLTRTLIMPRSTSKPRRRTALIAALAAVLVLALVSSVYFVINGSNSSHAPQMAKLTLPANLSWDKYVLYRQQTMTGSQGQNYTMTCYNDLSAQDANIEVTVPGKVDLVVVRDTKQSLGLDMMHHVAQWDSLTWIQADASIFDLASLRQDLSTGQATYLGEGSYNGQVVYRIHMPNGNILLLDMNYMPVNVLENVTSAGAGEPVYTALRWLLPSQVPSSTWDMTIPAHFSMGTLPPQI
jgi:hypothetical protein